MMKSRLSEITEKLCNVDLKCKYSYTCEHFKEDSETCMNALDKGYCGTYNAFTKRDNT